MSVSFSQSLLGPVVEPKGLEEEVLQGLALQQKKIPAKYFYDPWGSKLFERICETPEYYVTRTELAILQANAPEIASLVGPEALVFEYGSGRAQKTRVLLRSLRGPSAYVPVEISEMALVESVDELSREFPRLPMIPVCADFTQAFFVPARPIRGVRRRLVFFPGSTLGNFEPEEACALLQRTARLVGPGGQLLIGVDLQKPLDVLEAAYNDAQGVTAAFNLNLLSRLNRELGADFRVPDFQHLAFYNQQKSRIEMHLQSTKKQAVHIRGRIFRFRKGETIHTENSMKWTDQGLKVLAAEAGFSSLGTWMDEKGYFGISLLQVDELKGELPRA